MDDIPEEDQQRYMAVMLANDEQRRAEAGGTLPRKPRRIRMCHCPHCNGQTPLEPKSRGEDIYLSVCRWCFVVFANESVGSWLEDPL